MERLRLFSTARYRWLAVLWTLGIVLAFSLPAASLPPTRPALGVDKIVHVGLFVVFGGLWMRVLSPPRASWTRFWRWAGWLFLLGGLFAVGSELYQHVLPIHRMADPYDALADAAGLFVGILLYGAYARWQAPREASSPS